MVHGASFKQAPASQFSVRGDNIPLNSPPHFEKTVLFVQVLRKVFKVLAPRRFGSTLKGKVPIQLGRAIAAESPGLQANPFGLAGADITGWFWSLTLLQKALLLAVGFFFASPYGTNYILTVGDNFVGDAIIAPAIFVYLVSVRSAAPIRHELFSGLKGLCFVGLFLLFVGGAIATDGNVVASFTDFRCACLILGFYLLCSSNDDKIRVNTIYGAVVMAVVSLLASAVYYRFFPSEDGGVKNYFPSYGILLLAAVAVYEAKPFLAILGFVLSLYVAATSFYRSLMFLPIIFLLILARNFFRDISKREREPRRNALIIGTFFLAGVLSSGFVADAIMENLNSSEGAVEQGVTKLYNLVGIFQGKGLGEGDDLRAEYLKYIGSHLFSFIVPSGFGHKPLIGHWGPVWTDDKLDQVGSNSLDGMHLFFLCHFGLVLSVLIISYVSIRLSRSLLRTEGTTFALRTVILCFILGDSFVTASPFALISNAIFCGATIGCLVFLQLPQTSMAESWYQRVPL